MIVRVLPNGNLLVPVRLEGEDGTIGDATAEIGPDSPDFQNWVKWMKHEAGKSGRTAPIATREGRTKSR